MEDIVSEVRNKHIRVPLATAESGNWRYVSAVQISFEYLDRQRARKFTRALTHNSSRPSPPSGF
jgi:hypothetical protein